ncbi:hypothetical protein KC480_05995 [Bacillus velezensis]|uniref:hypothetical protein n=1 Tax=Bacillus velezensis TaxID=492670 RepID=UPI001E34EB8B|nr:hypothetical protein [Bacillus velezensis]MCD7911077.1 hypothetical protein [Bacillus velezensis]
MNVKEAKEIIRAGAAWANWTEKQQEAMRVAYNSFSAIEKIKKHCVYCDANKHTMISFQKT